MSDEIELSNEERQKIMKMCDDLIAGIANKGESAESRVRLANLHLRLGERDEAIISLQAALRMRPGTPAILVNKSSSKSKSSIVSKSSSPRIKLLVTTLSSSVPRETTSPTGIV